MDRLNLIILIGNENREIEVGLDNASGYSFSLSGVITFNEGDPTDMEYSIGPHQSKKIFKIPFDRINDYPHFELQVDKHTTRGHEDRYAVKIKPKPKHLVKADLLPEWGLPGKSYTLWNSKSDQSNPIRIPKPGKKPVKHPEDWNYFPLDNLSELAGFARELDLHASALFKNSKSVSPEVIYQRQLSEFATFIDRALRMNIDRVFIIHGVGKGKLRKAIHQKLASHPHVKEFFNEYHPKYGFGATEVIF